MNEWMNKWMNGEEYKCVWRHVTAGKCVWLCSDTSRHGRTEMLQLRQLFVFTPHFIRPWRNVTIFFIFEADATLLSLSLSLGKKSLQSSEYLLLHARFIYLKMRSSSSVRNGTVIDTFRKAQRLLRLPWGSYKIAIRHFVYGGKQHTNTEGF